MRIMAQLLFVALALPLAIGCSGGVCCGIPCGEYLVVSFEPEIGSTYDANLVLDSVAGAFTCVESSGGWSIQDKTGTVPVEECTGAGFRIDTSSPTVEISVSAKDGSWTGSAQGKDATHEQVDRNGLCYEERLTVPQQ